KYRGAGHPSYSRGDRLRLHRSWSVVRERFAARAALHGKARCAARRRVREGGKLFLEQRYVSVERTYPGQCAARTPAEDSSAAATDRRHVRHAEIRRNSCSGLSEVRKHQY